jgi:hypothetical protein
MMALLWLITTALGLRMIYEQSYDVSRLTGVRIRKTLVWCSAIWVVLLVRTAIWWVLPK